MFIILSLLTKIIDILCIAAISSIVSLVSILAISILFKVMFIIIKNIKGIYFEFKKYFNKRNNKFFISVSILILFMIIILVYLAVNLCYTWRDFFGTIIGSLFGLEGTLVVVKYSKNNTEDQIHANEIIQSNNSKISQMKMYRQNLFKYEDKLSNLNRSIGKIKADINLHIKDDVKLNDLIVFCKKWIIQLQSINGSKTIIFGELGSILQHILDLHEYKRNLSLRSSKENFKNVLNKFSWYERLWTTIINQTCGDMDVFIIRRQKGEYASKHDAQQIKRQLSSEFNEFLNMLQKMVEKSNHYINNFPH